MVTREELLNETEERRAKEEADKKHSEERRHKWQIRQRKKDVARAEGLLDGDLGEFLRKLNREDIHRIELQGHRVWKGQGKNEYYMPRFALGFTPQPQAKATKVLIEKLEEAGFRARSITRQYQNYETVITADGYDFVDKPGTHPEYFLEICW